MTDRVPLVIKACVTPVERAMMVAAGEQISEALGAPAGAPWPVRLVFSDFGTAAAEAAPVVVASLLADLFPLDRPMPEIAAAWRSRLAGPLCADRRSVFLCSVFRVVMGREDRVQVVERIRRLNLLAAELSGETGAYVVDLDFALSYFGAAMLQSDFRLTGPLAAEVAGHAVVTTILGADLSGVVPPEVQDAAVLRHGGQAQRGFVVDERLKRKAGGHRP